MKKYLLLLMALMLALLPAASLALTQADPLTGECYYPEGSDAETATYVYRYSFPQFAGEDDVVEGINAVYAYEADYIETFTLAINGDMYGTGETQYYTDLSAEVTCETDEWLSVCLTYDELIDAEPTHKMAGHVFALTGSRAGTVIALPYFLGILSMDENDEWLITRQTEKCDRCVREMVWEALHDLDVELYDNADREYFDGAFYPEEDFYLNADSDLVFFLQEDTMAYPEYGILTFTFSVDDILDEL